MLELAVDESLLERLKARFPRLDPQQVERCLREVCECAEHLDIHVTPSRLEALAVEHLTAIQQGRVTTQLRPGPRRRTAW